MTRNQETRSAHTDNRQNRLFQKPLKVLRQEELYIYKRDN